MRRLRFRRAAGALPNETRPRRQMIVRWVYLTFVIGLGLWLGNLFFGGYFYLRSEGLVLGNPAVVAAEYPITVTDIRVHEGEHVSAGQVVAVASSQVVSERLATLVGLQADREIKLSDLRVRENSLASLTELAQNRQTVSTDTRQKIDSLLKQGYIPLDKRIEAADSEYRSSEDLLTLKGQRDVMAEQITMLEQALKEAHQAVEDLRTRYDGGQLRAPIDGIVGHRNAEKGTVYTQGEPILELYDDERFVLAYVPVGGLFSVRPGEKVEISTGLQSYSGTIAKVEPIAAALPREFQRAFTPVDRQQLIRIEFDPSSKPPLLFTKVQLHAAFTLPSWTGLAFLATLFSQAL